MRVGLLYKANFSSSEEDKKRANQQSRTIEAVVQSLKTEGFSPFCIPLNPPDLSPLINSRAEVVFHLYSATGEEQAHVAALLELLRIPYTGSSPAGHLIALAKPVAKAIWTQAQIPTPPFFWHSDPGKKDFPLIVKPAFGGSGEGISSSSVVVSQQALRAQIQRVKTFSPLFAEKYIPGRELTVGILDNPVRALHPLEVSFTALPPEERPINSFAAKTKYSDRVDVKKARLKASLLQEVKGIAERSFIALGLRDYARADFRLDENDRPYIIEINSLPGLEPRYSDLPKAAELSGIPYSTLLRIIVESALARIA